MWEHSPQPGVPPLHPVLTLVSTAIGFEISVARLMEPNQNRHNLAQAQAARSFAVLQSIP